MGSQASPSLIPAPLNTLLTTALNPHITGPLLLALYISPSLLPFKLTWATPVLSTLLALGLLERGNRRLSRHMLNNGRPDAVFKKEEEIVLVTGGTSGIGQLIARRFAEEGTRVVVLDVNEPKEAFPKGVTFYKVDVTSSGAIAEAAVKMRIEVGEPTVLINNAGIGLGQTILGETEEGIRKTFEVNTISHFWTVREFLPAMIKKNKGHVVTVASMASFVVHASNVDYSCTKASALAFHEGLASELKWRYDAPDVKTTVVHPTWVRTALTEPLLANPDFKDYVLEPEVVSNAIVDAIMSGRSGQLLIPEEMSIAASIRAAPSWFQEMIRNGVGKDLEFLQE